jgi:hypothetical protein
MIPEPMTAAVLIFCILYSSRNVAVIDWPCLIGLKAMPRNDTLYLRWLVLIQYRPASRR